MMVSTGKSISMLLQVCLTEPAVLYSVVGFVDVDFVVAPEVVAVAAEDAKTRTLHLSDEVARNGR